MNSKVCKVVLIIMLVLGTLSHNSLAQSPDIALTMSTLNASEDNFVSGELIVKFKSTVNRSARAALLSTYDLTESKHIAGIDAYLMKTPKGTEKDTITALRRDARVLYAEPNYYRHAYFVPNDSYYQYQWHMPQIQMEQAWELATGAGVVVAVLDTGVAYEDYATYENGRSWTYQKAPDLANTNFTAGYDFINNDTHPNDNNAHGTHVAGTIAQSTNNGTGTAGVAYNATIMPVKVLNYEGDGTDQTIIDGIIWAADHGAQVINLSLGGDDPNALLENAVNYAYNRNVTVIAASGNGGSDGIGDPQVSYPAAYGNCLAIGATRYDETRSYYSNYGNAIDAVAPGGDINVDQDGNGRDDGILQQTFYPDTPQHYADPTDFSYYYFQGTSMAAPHAAGVAALLIQRGRDVGNPITPGGVRHLLLTTAKDKGATGWDAEYGYGLIQAYNALVALAPPATNTPTTTSTPTATPTNTPTPTSTNTPTNTPTPTPAVEVNKSALTAIPYPPPGTARPTLVYEVALDNQKPDKVTVYLTDALKSYVTYITDSATTGMIYDETSRSLLWNGELDSGAQQFLSFTVRILSGTREGTYLVNRVSIHDGTGIVESDVGTLFGTARIYMPLIAKNYTAPTPIPTQTPTATDTTVPTDTATPTITTTPEPVTPEVTPPPSGDWLAYMNYYRALAQLPPATNNATWSDGCWKHARYCVKNDYIGHDEDTGNPWYTPEGREAAQNGNVMVSSSTSASDEYSIDSWMSGPFHALGIIDPRLEQSGFGSYREADGGWQMAATLDVLRGLGNVPDTVSFPVYFPANGMTMPLLSYGGIEWPDPLTSCSGYTAPSGPPIMLQLGSRSTVPSVTAHSLSKDGAPQEHCVFDETNYTNPDGSAQQLGRSILNTRDAVVLMPRAPLERGAVYQVSITANSQTYTWSFTTAATTLNAQTSPDDVIKLGEPLVPLEP